MKALPAGDVGNGPKFLVFGGFSPSFGVCINTFVGLYTQIFGVGFFLLLFFCCTGRKNGGKVFVFS